jgi:hypothetical protein
MMRQAAQYTDNRDSGPMYEYLEARIEVMKRRIIELETEKARLASELSESTQGSQQRL